MRSVEFILLDANKNDIDDLFLKNNFQGPNTDVRYRWYFPQGPDPVLYIEINHFEWVEKFDLHAEYATLIKAINYSNPTLQITVDVTGRVHGENEIRFLTKMLLSAYRGFAFNDFTSNEHAWQLSEITAKSMFNGRGFFEYGSL